MQLTITLTSTKYQINKDIMVNSEQKICETLQILKEAGQINIAVGDEDKLRNGKGKQNMSNIQSNTQVASSSSDTISANANSLQEKEISKDTESNITAKGNSITAYETSQTQKSAYRYALEQDAQHIKTLGKTFEQVDQSIANILTAGLLGD